MDYAPYYAPAARELSPVEIREVADMIAGREVISLGAGWPSPESFPVELVSRLTADALADRGEEMLQYGTTRGHEGLRREIATRLRETCGADATAENVLVTAGSQQALYLAARAFVGDGDEVVVGAPTYAAALTAFDAVADPTYVPVPLDGDGMRMDALERELEGRDPAVVYTVPTFQNPTGVTASEARRRRLLALAREHDFLVLEDQPYRELRFEGTADAPLFAMDPERTVFLGTFSKVLAPGFRLGWIAADEDLIRTFELLKQPVDLQASVFCQHVAYEYLRTGAIDEGIGAIVDIYERKRDVALDALSAHMPEGVEWTRPGGGMFVWVTLPPGIDAKEMLPAAVENGVAYVPGYAFYAARPEHNTLRLNYTYVDDEELVEGIERLAATIREHA